MDYWISAVSKDGKCEIRGEAVRFVADGSCNEAFFQMEIMFPQWEKDCYVMMPGCAYNGNRFTRVKRNYPPMYRKEELGDYREPLITDVPALNPDGTGSIQVQTWMDTDISAGVVERKESLTPTPIARASTIGATDAFVESTSIIAVNRKSEEYTHSIAFYFGELTGYIDDGGSISPVEIRHTGMSVPFRIPPAFYDYMTDKPS
jgi:hypothetical protein